MHPDKRSILSLGWIAFLIENLCMEPIAKFGYKDAKPDAFPSDPIKSITDAVSGMLCGNLVNDPRLGPVANWTRSLNRSLLGCPKPPESPGNQPPVQVPTSQGGCPGVLYRLEVVGSYESKLINGQWERNEYVAGGGTYPGPITNVRSQIVDFSRQWFADAGIPGQPGYQQNIFFTATIVDRPEMVRASIATPRITRVDGQPDVCPDRVPTLPAPPTRFDPSPPPALIFPPSIEVEISPGIKTNLDIDVNLTVNGGINVRVANSIDIKFGPDSIDVYLNPEADIDIFPDAPAPGYELPDGYPDPPTGNNGSDGGGSEGDCATQPSVDELADKLNDLEELLNELLECACDKDSRPLQLIENTVGNNGVIVLSSRVRMIRVTLVETPDSPKIEWGGGAAPDVYYAGWAAFGLGSGFGERQPIDYQVKSFFPVKGSDRFSWTCRRNYTALIEVFGLPVSPLLSQETQNESDVLESA